MLKPRTGTAGSGAPDASKVWNKNQPVAAPTPKQLTDEEKTILGLETCFSISTLREKSLVWAVLRYEEDRALGVIGDIGHYRSQYDIEYCPPRDYISYGPSYQDVYRIGAVVVSLYNGALLKLAGILKIISPDAWDYEEKFWQHAERLLSAASFVAEQPNFHAKLQVSPPIIVAALCAPTVGQRARARTPERRR